jgi:hypothetical protein
MTDDAVAFHISRIEEQLQCHTFSKFYCNGSYDNTEAYVVSVTLIRKKICDERVIRLTCLSEA